MKDILIVLAFVVFIWSLYDYIKISILKIRFRKEHLTIIFTASTGRYISIIGGLCMGILCIIFGIGYSKDSLIMLGVLCFSASSREFCHSYVGVMNSHIIINGRLIGCDEIKKYGSIHAMSILSFINMLDIAHRNIENMFM